MANLITIDQLLESVDLDFEPRFITKDPNGSIAVWNEEPYLDKYEWLSKQQNFTLRIIGILKLAEFENKPWQECIYEVPRKTTGKIEKIDVGYKDSLKIKDWQDIAWTVERKINELVDAVNELKGAKNE